MARATLEILGVIALVYLGELLLEVAGPGAGVLALAWPLTHRPITLVTSVYAHASVGHLAANAAALLLVGPFLERATTRRRFHAYFLVAGGLAGAAQVGVGAVLGHPTAVIGASGAVLAVYGYVLVGNRASSIVLDVLPVGRAARLGGLVAVAILLTAVTAAPGVALVSHFTGILLGGIAGRAGVLRVD